DELAQDADFRARFERESRLAASLDHPNIIPIFEAGELDGTVYLAMRYVEGTDFASRLRAAPTPTPDAVLHILVQIAKALDAAHARGLVHRDVKPANVLLDPSAGDVEGDHAYLTDFGLTKQAGSESGLTKAGSFMGTLAYMAPEQIEGVDVDGRADEYSLAAMAFEALTGSVPFKRDQEIAVAMAHLKDPVPSAVALQSSLPPSVDVVLAKGMAKDPADRYPTCASLIADLRAALSGESVQARPIRDRRLPIAIGALGVGVAVLFALILIPTRGGTTGTSTPTASGPIAAISVPPSPVSGSAPPSPQPTLSDVDRRLIEWMPDDLPADCVRGVETLLPTRQGPSLKPLGNIACTTPGGAGPEVVEGFDPTFPLSSTPGDGPKAFVASDVIIGLAAERGLIDGDCATATSASAIWRPGQDGASDARVFCDLEDGQAVLGWSVDDAALYVAREASGDRQQLYTWWLVNRAAFGPAP
ncbi:MAG TPA: serine/threonine-protein kinase, partial [Candidatus Saccharimonadia bacterium]|nr:serine/threonine-protein kinase [Candidatus Saccharimonadia bacterium]